MNVPCTALPQLYLPPTPDDIFNKIQPAFNLDLEDKKVQGGFPTTGHELIRRKVIEFLSDQKRDALKHEQEALAVYHSRSVDCSREMKRLLHLVPPQTTVLDLINYQVLLVERYLIVEVVASLSYQDRITLLYHYRNDSNLLESVRLRSRLFKRLKELCS